MREISMAVISITEYLRLAMLESNLEDRHKALEQALDLLETLVSVSEEDVESEED